MGLKRFGAVMICGALAWDSADAGQTVGYAYDALGRLVTATHTRAVNNNLQATYGYDSAGNRTGLAITGAQH